ncbi:MAG: MFS transporter [Verrucomicrobia bacterium]|nr:MFS transporter [Verrucomicrobiota bacterium]
MSQHDPRPGEAPADAISRGRARLLLAALVLGYIGIYLCRKNFSVAVPLIREAFSLSKEQIGIVASASTLAYMIGKFTFGPLIDRFGGRASCSSPCWPWPLSARPAAWSELCRC